MNELKQIPFNGDAFEANGKKYFVEDTLSIERWIYMQELNIQLGFGVEFADMQKAWLEVRNLANESKFADIVILGHNMVNGISKAYNREPMILKFCALFMNTEEEDRGFINEDQISRKIEDWKAEGLGIDGFFVFSLSKVKGLAESWQKATLDVSETLGGLTSSNQTANDQN